MRFRHESASQHYTMLTLTLYSKITTLDSVAAHVCLKRELRNLPQMYRAYTRGSI